jgi:hypothetical protein
MKVFKYLHLLDTIWVIGAESVDEKMSALKTAFESVKEYKIGQHKRIMEPHRALIPMMYKEYNKILFRENDTFECRWIDDTTLLVFHKSWKVAE